MTSATKAVTILGFFQDRREAPRGDGAEIWGLNQLAQVYDDKLPWDRWFEMHALDFLKKWKPEYVDWLAAQTRGPIYMQAHHDDIPMSVAYPRAEVNAYLMGHYGAPFDYFTSSFSYELALAIFERFDRIGLYGIGLIEDGEHSYERAGLEYLIGLAQGTGIQVALGRSSPILKIHYVYGYSEPRMRVSDVEAVVDFLDQSEAILKEQMKSFTEWLDQVGKDHPDYGRGVIAEAEMNSQRRLLKDLRTWLKHYGRGGALLAPDGSLNPE